MKKPVVLYGPRGEKIDASVLQVEQGRAQLAGIRNIWAPVIAPDLTPERLASILRRAIEGDASDYLQLAMEMEERDLHYASVLSTRKLAVSGVKPTVTAASDSPEDEDIAEEVRELLKRPEAGELVSDLLDALGKGYSVVEIVWKRSASRWEPERYEWRDPRFFRFDIVTGQELRLLDDDNPAFGSPLKPYKWIVHKPRLKTGIPIRGGLARLACAAFLCKSYTLKDWLAFAEVFGMPLRVGKYGPGATEDDIATLVAAVANIGTDAAAVVPDSMKIEYEAAAAGAGGTELFRGLAEWIDKQMSKGVLGQTMTVDDGASLSQSKIHNEVRGDIRQSDMRQAGVTLSRDLAQPYVELNHGPQKRYPMIEIIVEEPEDVAALAAAVPAFIDRGLKVGQNEIRAKLGLTAPTDEDELLTPMKSGASTSTPLPASVQANRAQTPEPAADDDDIDRLRIEALGDWQEQVSPIRDQLAMLAASCATFEEFRAGLGKLVQESTAQAVGDALALAMFKGRVLGNMADR